MTVLAWKGDCYCLQTRLNNKRINLSVIIWYSVPYVVVKTCLISTSRTIQNMQTNFILIRACVKINCFNENWLQTSVIIIAFISPQKIIYCHGNAWYSWKQGSGRGGLRRGPWIGQQWASLAASNRPDSSATHLSADLQVCAQQERAHLHFGNFSYTLSA